MHRVAGTACSLCQHLSCFVGCGRHVHIEVLGRLIQERAHLLVAGHDLVDQVAHQE